jgi:hypothetical protein
MSLVENLSAHMKSHHHCPVHNKTAAAAGCGYFDEKCCMPDLVDHMTQVEMEQRVHKMMMMMMMMIVVF